MREVCGGGFVQEWDADYEGLDLLKQTLAVSDSKEPMGQGRCTGFGGGIKAVKVKKGGCHGDGSCDEKVHHKDHDEEHEKELGKHEEDGKDHAAKAARKLERKAADFDSLESALHPIPLLLFSSFWGPCFKISHLRLLSSFFSLLVSIHARLLEQYHISQCLSALLLYAAMP